MSVASASFAQVAISASYAQSSSYANSASYAATSISASYAAAATSASFAQSAISASYANSASFAVYAQTASHAEYAISSSYALASTSASYANSSSYAATAISASYANSASYATQAINAVSASWITGSNVVGTVASATSASYALTASYASNVPATASFAISSSNADTANTATSASFAQFAISASYASNVPATASFAVSASNADTANTASYALTASYAMNGGGGGLSALYIQDEGITQGTASYIDFVGAGVTATVSNGTASINIAGGGGGGGVVGQNAVLNQTVAATTWSFTHNLGTQYPVFTIFDSNDNVIIPQQIYAASTSSALIYFSTPRAGHAVASLGGGIVSSSYAESASYALTATSASYARSSSYAATAISASYSLVATSASYAANATSASYAINATSASWITGSNVIGIVTSASYAATSTSASYANSASYTVYAQTASLALNSELLNGTSSGIFATTGSNVFKGNQTIFGNLYMSGSFPLVYNNDATSNMLFGMFDGSAIYGPYYQLFGNQYSNITQRGGAEFVYDIRNNADANFHIASFNGSTWTEKFRVDDNGVRVTGSLIVTNGITGSLQGTASWAENAITASYAANTTTASYALTATSASYANSSSYAVFAQTASSAEDFTVRGTLTAQTLVVQVITSSVELVTGSLTVSGSLNALAGVTGSLLGTASFAISASSADIANSASFAQTAISSSYSSVATSASYAATATSASYAISATSASFAQNAISASYAPATSNVLGGVDYYVPVWSGSNTLVTGSIRDYGYSQIDIFSGANNYGTIIAYAATEPRLYLSSSNNDRLIVYNSYGQVAVKYEGSTHSNNLIRYSGYDTRITTLQTDGTNRVTIDRSGSIQFNAYTTNGLLKTSGSNGTIVNATAGTDYVIPSALDAYVLNSATSSMSVASASLAQAAISSSYSLVATTASYANNATSASYAANSTTASYALTASYAMNGGGGGGISAIYIADEGTIQGTASFFDFTGAGVTATVSAGTASIYIPGGGSGGSAGLSTFFTQSVAAVTWSFTHNLNTRTPLVQVYDTSYNLITPQYVSASNSSVVEIGFGIATAGYAVASTGGTLTVTGSNVILDQSVAAATWSFAHNLNTQYPIFQVFNSSNEVIVPERIVAVDTASALIYFPTTVAGKAVASLGGLSGSITVASASFAQTAVSSSYSLVATSASYASTSTSASYAVNATSASWITGSNVIGTVSNATTASYALTASYAANVPVTASYALTASYLVGQSPTSSYAISASYAAYANNAPGYTVQFTQSSAATTWSFVHNLNTRNPIVQVYDTNYKQIIPNDIVGVDVNTAEVRFDYAQAGYAVMSNGGGLYVTGSTSELVQTVGATTWSFTHNLNSKYVAFEVYDSNDYVIIPAGIRVLTTNTAELYFAGSQTGRAVAQFSGINGAPNATTASYASTATSASYSVSSSFAYQAQTASYLAPVTSGYVVLTQVSQSLNFADDAAAAAGGVPLGGLYRNGNFILIRIS